MDVVQSAPPEGTSFAPTPSASSIASAPVLGSMSSSTTTAVMATETPWVRWKRHGFALKQETTPDDPAPLAAILLDTPEANRPELIESSVLDMGMATALHVASSGGKLNVVRWLVNSAKANLNSRNSGGCTPLHRACSEGQLDVAKFLISEAGADIEAVDDLGWTPLHIAVCNNREEVVRYLLERNADATVRTKEVNSILAVPDGLTPLDIAQLKCHTQLILLLPSPSGNSAAQTMTSTTSSFVSAFPSAAASVCSGSEPKPAETTEPRYEAMDVIGEGRFGTVYKAKRMGEGASPDAPTYALKVVTLSGDSEEEERKALAEIQMLTSVAHPGVVHYFNAYTLSKPDPEDSSRTIKELHIGMEYCAGGSLGMLEGMPEPPAMKEIARQVLQSLQALHEKIPAIQHFDIKPDNICLGKPFNNNPADVVCKLVDFGLARETAPAIHCIRGGSKAFWSPERLAGKGFNLKDDMWAAGLTLLYVGMGLASRQALATEVEAHLPGSPDYMPRLRQLFWQFEDRYGEVLAVIVRSMLLQDPLARASASTALLFLAADGAK